MLQHGQYFALGVLGSLIDRGGYRLRHLFLAGGYIGLAAIEINNVVMSDPHFAPFASFWFLPFLIWLATMGCVWGSLHWKNAIAAAATRFSKPIRHLGLITFPLYTLHNHTGGPALAALRRMGVPPGVAILVGMIVAFLAASVVVEVLEPRMRAIVERLLFIRSDRPARIAASVG